MSRQETTLQDCTTKPGRLICAQCDACITSFLNKSDWCSEEALPGPGPAGPGSWIQRVKGTVRHEAQGRGQ